MRPKSQIHRSQQKPAHKTNLNRPATQNLPHQSRMRKIIRKIL